VQRGGTSRFYFFGINDKNYRDGLHTARQIGRIAMHGMVVMSKGVLADPIESYRNMFCFG
jgi:hypothetical protein